MSTKVNSFKPTVTLVQFQTAITSQAPEAQVIPIVMAALSRYRLDVLTKGLEPHLVAKVEDCSRVRSKRVLQAILGLNALGDKRDALLESCAPYRTAKASYKAAQEAFSCLDKAKAEQAIKEVMPKALNPKVMARLEKLSYRPSLPLLPCMAPSSWASYFDSIKLLTATLDDSNRDAKKIAEQTGLLCIQLKCLFVDSLYSGNTKHMSEEEMDIYLQVDNNHRVCQGVQNQEVKKFIESELPRARKNAIGTYKSQLAAAEKSLAEQTAAFKNCLTTYVESTQQYYTTNDYLSYAAQKKVVYDECSALGSFCTKSELLSHPKVNNESILRLDKLIPSS